MFNSDFLTWPSSVLKSHLGYHITFISCLLRPFLRLSLFSVTGPVFCTMSLFKICLMFLLWLDRGYLIWGGRPQTESSIFIISIKGTYSQHDLLILMLTLTLWNYSVYAPSHTGLYGRWPLYASSHWRNGKII